MKKFKQIVCLLGAALLVGIYVITLVFAFTDNTASKSWLSASLFSTFAIPIFLYAFLLILRLLEKKREENDKTKDTTEP